MAKITFIGAGSTVFAAQLAGRHPRLRGARGVGDHAVRHRRRTARDVGAGRAAGRRRARRAGQDPGDHRPPRRARRRRLRDQHDPGRWLRAVHGDRLRGPQAFRAPPDDRRHTRHRRDHARPAHDPGAPLHVRRHGGALPRHVVPQLHEPDGDQLPRDLACEQHQDRRPVPQRAGHRVRAVDGPRYPLPRDRLPRGRHQSHGLLPPLRAQRRRPLPAPAGTRGVGRGTRGQPRALRGVEASRLLRDRIERALRRVRAVVHQARPARDRRAAEHPARRVPAPLHRPDRALGERARRARARRRDRRAAELRVRLHDHPQHRDRQAARRSTATCPIAA